MSGNALFIDDNSPQFADPVSGKLDIFAILAELRREGIISEENHKVLSSVRANATGDDKNALQVIADCGWDHLQQPGKKITLDRMIEWLSAKVDMPVKKIDPLNIDVASITGVMSLAYARRFNIIALEVSPQSVIIGTAEPFFEGWEAELAGVLRKTIVRVLVNPDDIKRYLHEFYNVSKSVLGAKNDQSSAESSKVQNLEQLMELGRKGGLDVNDQHLSLIHI